MKGKFFLGFIALLIAGGVEGQARVKGRVSDDKSVPIAGVTVHFLNTEITAIGDTAGYFTIRHIGPGRYTMQLSAIGYTTLAVPVEIRNGDNPMSFHLSSSLLQLDAVTVTADKKEEL